MRWVVVVLLLVGCFTKPGLRDRDGGGGGDGGGDDGGDDDGGMVTDGPMVDQPDPLSCHYVTMHALFLSHTLASGPWISGDYKTVFYVDDTTHEVHQAHRTVDDSAAFETDIVVKAGVSTDPDPSFSADLLRMYYRNPSGDIVRAARASLTAPFLDEVDNTPLQLVNTAANGVNSVSEGPWLSPDEKTILFVSGTNEGSMTYDSEDLYVATRSTMNGAFTTPKKLAISVDSKNDCCPTFANGLLMWERPIQQFIDIKAATWDGSTTFGPIATLPFSGSFGQPAASADGARLLYVELDSGKTIKEAFRVCP